jgi:hypothetical protein
MDIKDNISHSQINQGPGNFLLKFTHLSGRVELQIQTGLIPRLLFFMT